MSIKNKCQRTSISQRSPTAIFPLNPRLRQGFLYKMLTVGRIHKVKQSIYIYIWQEQQWKKYVKQIGSAWDTRSKTYNYVNVLPCYAAGYALYVSFLFYLCKSLLSVIQLNHSNSGQAKCKIPFYVNLRIWHKIGPDSLGWHKCFTKRHKHTIYTKDQFELFAMAMRHICVGIVSSVSEPYIFAYIWYVLIRYHVWYVYCNIHGWTF